MHSSELFGIVDETLLPVSISMMARMRFFAGRAALVMTVSYQIWEKPGRLAARSWRSFGTSRPLVVR